MEPASTVQKMSFRKNPRDGQSRVLAELGGRSLNVQLPTGYGKTFTACAAYSELQRQGRVNRLLFIVPTSAQLRQFDRGGHEDLADAGVLGSHSVTDISFFRASALRRHRNNECQVYVTTIQAMSNSNGMDIVTDLMATGRWMVVVDEYHHYGVEKTWGIAVEKLNYEFRLAMSATPYRAGDDGAFGEPDVIVEYTTAVAEKAVKPLVGHSYTYKIDAITADGDVVSYTTSDLARELGVDIGDAGAIEKRRIERKMRWSPKYVSPLVSIPLERMQVESIRTGFKLQAIIGAMCVSHAEMVCSQVKAMFPELSVDWVGTGDDGRSVEKNQEILDRFCPDKDEMGRRNHTLDVLVHVGMAGEGLDSVNVSEVIHLNGASINNSNNQENGRAARYLEGVVGNINFDSCTGYAKEGYIGEKIMDAMDFKDPSVCGRCKKEPCVCADPESSDHVPTLPDEPTIQIHNMEVIDINSGGVQRMARALSEDSRFSFIKPEDLKDKDSPVWEHVINAYRGMRMKEAEQHDEKSVVLQWKDSVNKATSVVTGRVMKAMTANGRQPTALAGDVKKWINGRKKRDVGPVTNDVESCRKHYQWLKNLEQEIIDSGIPSWLQ